MKSNRDGLGRGGLLLPLLMLMTGVAPVFGAEVTLVRDGKARVVIVAPAALMAPPPPVAAGAAPPPSQRLRESVLDLARCLEKISGAKIDILTREPDRNSPLLPIFIGMEAEKRFGPPRKRSPFKQGWRMAVSGKGIALLGESEEASSYAVYELLDRLGCRWYMPGDTGEALPSAKTIRLKEMDISDTPATVSREIWYADEAFKRRNRLGGLVIAAGHALEISGYVSKEQLTAHPDWNAEIDGKRSVNGRFCWGNPEVASAVADGILAQLDKRYTPTISLSPDDGFTFCQCSKCKALDAGDWDPTLNQVSITDRYVHFCNQIVAKVTRKYPNVLFGFLAYVQYTRPPIREKPHPQLVPEIAPISYCRAHAMTDPICPSRQSMRQIVEGWGRAAKSISYYNYMYHLAEVSVPYPMMHQMTEELPILYRNGVTFWQPETLPNFESALPGFYLSIRKSWYTTADAPQILNEFFTRFYGTAAQPMRRYWQIFDDAWTNSSEHAGCAYGYGRRFPPEILAAAHKAVDEALAVCRTDTERARVTMQVETLRQFEQFMKLRRSLFEGQWAGLEQDGHAWMDAQAALGEKYANQYAFAKTYWAARTVGTYFFDIFYQPTYQDASRIARTGVLLTPPLRKWRFAVDRAKNGEALGWGSAEFGDAAWKATDPCLDTWADLGLTDFFGTVWYRAKVQPEAFPVGKKVFLWLGGVDGSVRVYVNGRKAAEAPPSFAKPLSFDITALLKPGVENQITVVGTREALNEVGTGGLLGPVVLYRER